MEAHEVRPGSAQAEPCGLPALRSQKWAAGIGQAESRRGTLEVSYITISIPRNLLKRNGN